VSEKLNNLSFRTKRELYAIACFWRDEIGLASKKTKQLVIPSEAGNLLFSFGGLPAVSCELSAGTLHLSTFEF
jgi:hypothetical protein